MPWLNFENKTYDASIWRQCELIQIEQYAFDQKKQNIKSKYLSGPSTYHLRRKKFKSALKFIL